MNDAIFSNSFRFRVFQHDADRVTDNRRGIRCHFLAYLEAGSCRISTEHETIFVERGDIFYLPNGLKYQSFWHGEPGMRFISLGFGFLPNFEGHSYGPQVVPGCEETVRLFHAIAACREPDAAAVGMLYSLVGLLLPRMACTRLDRRSELVDFAKKYILEHPEASAAEIARAAAVSESALYLAFQTSSEESIREFRSKVRLEEARRLLVSSDMSVEALSEALHFSSGSYFRKCFKAYFGITPREMRKKYDI